MCTTKRSRVLIMEAAGWKYATTNEPQPEVTLFYSISDSINERQLVWSLHSSGTPFWVFYWPQNKMTHSYSIFDSINNRQLVWSVHFSQAPLFFNDVKIKWHIKIHNYYSWCHNPPTHTKEEKDGDTDRQSEIQSTITKTMCRSMHSIINVNPFLPPLNTAVYIVVWLTCVYKYVCCCMYDRVCACMHVCMQTH